MALAQGVGLAIGVPRVVAITLDFGFQSADRFSCRPQVCGQGGAPSRIRGGRQLGLKAGGVFARVAQFSFGRAGVAPRVIRRIAFLIDCATIIEGAAERGVQCGRADIGVTPALQSKRIAFAGLAKDLKPIIPALGVGPSVGRDPGFRAVAPIIVELGQGAALPAIAIADAVPIGGAAFLFA